MEGYARNLKGDRSYVPGKADPVNTPSKSHLDFTATDGREQRIKKTNFTSNCHFAVLLSPDFIQSNFGPNTYQVRSGESIVSNTKINDQFVYKCPLKKLDLQKLCQLFTQPPPSIESCALPIDSIFITDCFFKFNLYISPLPKSVAKFSFRWFFVVLLEAINALHDVGIAHLDVRLENICYKEDGMVVLIDLDRSLPTDCPAITLSSYYGNSLMYRPGNDDWTCKQQDMRQLAILIGDIAGNDDYHTIPPNEEVNTMISSTMNGKGKAMYCQFELSLV